jgi:hypothetical protein
LCLTGCMFQQVGTGLERHLANFTLMREASLMAQDMDSLVLLTCESLFADWAYVRLLSCVKSVVSTQRFLFLEGH